MALINALLEVIYIALNFYMWVLIINVIMSWLTAFGIINTYQPFVQTVGRILYALTEPALRPIRRFIPTVSGIDFSTLVLIFIIIFLQSFIRNLLYAGF